jgi:hypothetical protein
MSDNDTIMPRDEAIWRVLATLTGHDRVDEMAADLVSGLHAAGYIIVPWKAQASDIVLVDGKPTSRIFALPQPPEAEK